MNVSGVNSFYSPYLKAQTSSFKASALPEKKDDLNIKNTNKSAVPFLYRLRFGSKLIDGVLYSESALKLGMKRISGTQAKLLREKSLEKQLEVQNKIESTKNTAEPYKNSRQEVSVASVLGKNNKIYTACNVDFGSSRWGVPSGILASCKAVNDFNDSVKALFLSNRSTDKRTIEWLTNNSCNKKMDRTRGGNDVQLVLQGKRPDGHKTLNVVTLADLKRSSLEDMDGLDLSLDPIGAKPGAVKPNPGIIEYKPQRVNIKTIKYSENAQKAARELAAEKGINVDEMVKNLVLKSQEEANKLDKQIVARNGEFDNAPNSHYRYISAAQADNGKIYTALNSEFYGEFMADTLCSERTAVAKAVDEGANKIHAIAVNNNQNHSDACCAECLGWMSGNRGGANLLIANIVRDKDGNKTDKVLVKTLSELLTDIHAPSGSKKV